MEEHLKFTEPTRVFAILAEDCVGLFTGFRGEAGKAHAEVNVYFR